MKTKINLDNNYYLEVLEEKNIDKEIINIEKINIIDILKIKRLILKIDFSIINEKKYKKVLKKLHRIKKVISKIEIEIGKAQESKTLLGYIINYDENNKKQKEFILAINAIFYSTRYERYNYIYDTVCDSLDSYFYGKNLCDFKDNQCGEKRNTTSKEGCCHHLKNKWLGPIGSKMVVCEYLNENHTCSAKCISCKLFTCDYLRKKGIEFKIKDILLLKVFLNPLQKYFIKYMVFTPKDKIIKRLMLL